MAGGGRSGSFSLHGFTRKDCGNNFYSRHSSRHIRLGKRKEVGEDIGVFVDIGINKDMLLGAEDLPVRKSPG